MKPEINQIISCDEAASWGADLIVMGKLGKRGVSRILLGSVAERVIEFANLPVLLVNAYQTKVPKKTKS
ncbi:MAG: universal stress protein [Deltaproteobacteria bacterium]|nr:universal stress protein [Deltaproteobacteria bacterium]